ncbi:hypothetical protein A5780_06460 [Nocardia sp. 852002-20019_SCH5090214]|uniref:hypothetical protein n=1 Tax=Nocardia sp. 852002-20019_SCH5090214 TaxID=1834087 RepID=UPI0007EB056B|nr:hypothetical protein [Nocardia sp. 852002-20019_SCH5090214]OBA41672.1 hypothetical protein A5780_06460 [Nocardia sp. 852002-20019_SCH5090214]
MPEWRLLVLVSAVGRWTRLTPKDAAEYAPLTVAQLDRQWQGGQRMLDEKRRLRCRQLSQVVENHRMRLQPVVLQEIRRTCDRGTLFMAIDHQNSAGFWFAFCE